MCSVDPRIWCRCGQILFLVPWLSIPLKLMPGIWGKIFNVGRETLISGLSWGRQKVQFSFPYPPFLFHLLHPPTLPFQQKMRRTERYHEARTNRSSSQPDMHPFSPTKAHPYNPNVRFKCRSCGHAVFLSAFSFPVECVCRALPVVLCLAIAVVRPQDRS